jgi:hypothetical protein
VRYSFETHVLVWLGKPMSSPSLGTSCKRVAFGDSLSWEMHDWYKEFIDFHVNEINRLLSWCLKFFSAACSKSSVTTQKSNTVGQIP